MQKEGEPQLKVATLQLPPLTTKDVPMFEANSVPEFGEFTLHNRGCLKASKSRSLVIAHEPLADWVKLDPKRGARDMHSKDAPVA
jgi:hypothetical protein